VATLTHDRRRRSQAAREVFQMIDDDESGTLEKPEIVEAIQG
jgi:Ca2+-binding EF-hand superfamily protein